MCTLDIYKELQECYSTSEKTYSDKAKSFRSIYEKFVNEQAPDLITTKYPLGQKLREMFKRCNIEGGEQIEDASKALIERLNRIVHEDIPISSKELNTYYYLIIQIIKMLTGIEPSAKQLLVAGLSENAITSGLNNEQRCAVLDDSQFVNVNAGPGTGKTHLLVRKLLYTLYQHPDWNIVALSFTNSAATQLKERVLGILEDACNAQVSPKNCTAATIHSFCFNLLSQYMQSKDETFDYEILDDSVIDEIVNDIAEHYNLQYNKELIKEALTNNTHNSVYAKVEEYKKQHHFIRVEEILDIFLQEINKEDEDFRNWMKGKVNSLLIDESQDLSRKVYNIIDRLYYINPDMHLFFVGDPRQNIFSFNDGRYENYRKFIKSLEITPKEYNLTVTYRCPRAITNLVNGLTFTDCGNPSLVPQNDIMGKCEIIATDSNNCEAQRIVDIIRSINNHKETCVIATGLWCLEKTASMLNYVGIPFVVKGGQTIMKPAIKMINHCLRLVEKDNNNSVNRLLKSGFTPEFIKKLKAQRMSQKSNPMMPAAIIATIITWIKNDYSPAEETLALLKDYANAVKDYNSISELLFACSSKRNDEFAKFYQRNFNVSCTTEVTDDNQYVTLSTIHSAKGLEWENVILAQMADDILPSFRCFAKDNVSQSREMLNDEKKKYYVAVTRSKRNIYITYPTQFMTRYGKICPKTLSRFVKC